MIFVISLYRAPVSDFVSASGYEFIRGLYQGTISSASFRQGTISIAGLRQGTTLVVPKSFPKETPGLEP
jgi:hypothetical protein